MSAERVRIKSKHIAVCECGYVSPIYEHRPAAEYDAELHAGHHDKYDDWPAALPQEQTGEVR